MIDYCNYLFNALITMHADGTFQAIDKDVGYGSDVHYRMTKGNTTLFNVTKDGLVSAKPLRIDTKNKGHYEITVEALNKEVPYTHCHFKNCTQIITINIQVSCVRNKWASLREHLSSMSGGRGLQTAKRRPA